jgi:hypothetical protein
MKILLGFLLVVCPSIACSQPNASDAICDAKDARENFACSIEGSYMLCSLKGQLAALNGDWSEVQACRRTYQPAVRKSFDSAMSKLKGKTAAQAGAKAAYAEWIAATDGLMPKADESKVGYRGRTASLEDALKKRVAVFKIDAGIE